MAFMPIRDPLSDPWFPDTRAVEIVAGALAAISHENPAVFEQSARRILLALHAAGLY
jgi:hypothetical protein